MPFNMIHPLPLSYWSLLLLFDRGAVRVRPAVYRIQVYYRSRVTEISQFCQQTAPVAAAIAARKKTPRIYRGVQAFRFYVGFSTNSCRYPSKIRKLSATPVFGYLWVIL